MPVHLLIWRGQHDQALTRHCREAFRRKARVVRPLADALCAADKEGKMGFEREN